MLYCEKSWKTTFILQNTIFDQNVFQKNKNTHVIACISSTPLNNFYTHIKMSH